MVNAVSSRHLSMVADTLWCEGADVKRSTRGRSGLSAATTYDVARLAGVSQPTVSRAFNGAAGISASTREKIIQTAAKIGYRPNLIARSLITRKSKIVGVLISYLYNSYFPLILTELAKQLERIGYRILLFVTDPEQSPDPALEEVLRYRLDGVILVAAQLSSKLDEECHQAGVPVVLINRKTQSATVSSVTADNIHGSEIVAKFLIAGGHRRFAYIASVDSSTNREREDGYFNVIKQNGYETPLRELGNNTFADTAQAARRLLRMPRRPDAVFCCNDYMALSFISVAREEFDIEIGRGLSVVGFDNAQQSDWPLFNLTSYEQSVQKIAVKAVEILSRQLEGSASEGGEHVISGALIVRSSARLPQGGIVTIDGQKSWKPSG